MKWKIPKKRTFPERYAMEGEPYRSGFESEVGRILTNCRYEKLRIAYSVPSIYTPDFDFPDKPWAIVEVKGMFYQGAREARKYVEIKKQNKNIELIFIFENPKKKVYAGIKRRKDGTYRTMGEWAVKNGFMFFSGLDIPDWFVNGDFDRHKIRDEFDRIKTVWISEAKNKTKRIAN